jgi:hypothetical protein
MMRVDNWPLKLAAEVDSANGRPFEFGVHDCMQFAARCFKAVTGDDKLLLFPSYSTEAEAMQIAERFGGLEGLLRHELGEPRHPAFAMRGDIVLCDMGQGPQPAVCIGVWCVAPGLRRLEKRMTDTALMAWSI